MLDKLYTKAIYNFLVMMLIMGLIIIIDGCGENSPEPPVSPTSNGKSYDTGAVGGTVQFHWPMDGTSKPEEVTLTLSSSQGFKEQIHPGQNGEYRFNDVEPGFYTLTISTGKTGSFNVEVRASFLAQIDWAPTTVSWIEIVGILVPVNEWRCTGPTYVPL